MVHAISNHHRWTQNISPSKRNPTKTLAHIQKASGQAIKDGTNELGGLHLSLSSDAAFGSLSSRTTSSERSHPDYDKHVHIHVYYVYTYLYMYKEMYTYMQIYIYINL